MLDYESTVINEFNHLTSNFYLFGIYLGGIEVEVNKEVCNQERDIILKGEMRLANGLPLLLDWNIEIESRRPNKKKINSKYNSTMLLSIISPYINQKTSCNKYIYSEISYNRGTFNYVSINPYNFYSIDLVGRETIDVLEAIKRSKINQTLKRALLFYLGDRILEDRSIKKVEFFDDEKIVKLYSKYSSENIIIMDESNKNIWLNPQNIYLSKNKELHEGKLSLLTDLDFVDGFSEGFKDSGIQRIYFVSGTNKEVGLGSSLKKIEKL